MRNLKALVRLDFIFVKTYWLWVVFFLGIALLLGLSNQNAAGFILNLTIFMVVITLFPYERMTVNNVNIMYGSLPTNRQSIVNARFIFTAIVLLVIPLIGVPVGIAMEQAILGSINWHETWVFLALSSGIFLVFTAWNAPFLMKFGYAKGKFYFFGLLGVVMLVFNLPGLLSTFGVEEPFNVFNSFFEHYQIGSIIALAVGVVSFAVSYVITRKIYLSKDL